MADFRSYVEFNVVRPIVSVVQELVGRGGSEEGVEVNPVDGGNGFAVACDVRPAQLTVLNQCTTLNTVDSVPTRRFSWRKSELEPDVNETIIVHQNSVNFARGGCMMANSKKALSISLTTKLSAVALETEADKIGEMKGNSVACSISISDKLYNTI